MHVSILVCNASKCSYNNMDWKYNLRGGHVCVHAFMHRVHLELTDLVTHLGLLDCGEPPLAQRNLQVVLVRVLAADPRLCSKSCHSACAVLHG